VTQASAPTYTPRVDFASDFAVTVNAPSGGAQLPWRSLRSHDSPPAHSTDCPSLSSPPSPCVENELVSNPSASCLSLVSSMHASCGVYSEVHTAKITVKRIHTTSLRSLACGWPSKLHPQPVKVSHDLDPPVARGAWAAPRYCYASSCASSGCSRWRHSVQFSLPGARATGLEQPSCWHRLPPPCAWQ
jgi:hypothetical protein